LLDRLNDRLADHHLRTAFLVDQLGRRLNLRPKDHQLAVSSALLHDLGLTPLGLRADDLLREEDFDLHSQTGWLMLQTCPRLAEESWLVRYHHTDWSAVRLLPRERRRAGELANLIRLADYLDISARIRPEPRAVRTALKGLANDIFGPDQVEAARDLLFTPRLFPDLSQAARELTLSATAELALDEDEALTFAFMFSKIVDSRSPFAAMHSVMTACLGLLLHQMAGGRTEDTQAIYMAGLLHDVGMLGVPQGPIEKRGALSREEQARVSEHPALTYEILAGLPGFNRVAVWASCHHERLDGGGYPRGLKGGALPLESRVIAVADVLAALTEHRPHRRALSAREALKVLAGLVKSRALDGDLVEFIHHNINYFSMLQHDTYHDNRPFFKGLINEMSIAARDRLSRAWRNILDCPYPLSA